MTCGPSAIHDDLEDASDEDRRAISPAWPPGNIATVGGTEGAAETPILYQTGRNIC